MAEMRASVIMDLVDRVSRPASRIRSTFSRFSRDSGLDRVRQSFRGVRTEAVATVGAMQTMGRRLLLFGGATAGAAWGLNRFVGGSSQAIERADRLARRLGMTTDELFALQGAAEMEGVAGFDRAMQSFQRRMAEAAAGTGEAHRAMQWLIGDTRQLRDASGNLRPTAELLDLVADRVGDIEDTGLQARLMRALFGQSGEDMIELLRDGRIGLDELKEAARQAGWALDEQGVRRAREYNSEVDALTMTVQGLRREIAIELMPHLTDWLQRVTDLTRANRGMISEDVVRFLRDVGEVGGTVARYANYAAEAVGGWRNALIGLGAILAGRVLMRLWNLGKAAGLAAIEIADLARRIGALRFLRFTGWLGIIAGGAWLIRRNWADLPDYFRDKVNGVTDVLGGLRRYVTGMLTADMQQATDGLREMWRGVQTMFGAELDFIGPIAEKARELREWIATRPLYQAGADMIGDFLSGIREQMTGFGEWVRDTVRGWFDFSLPRFGVAPGIDRERGESGSGDGRTGAAPILPPGSLGAGGGPITPLRPDLMSAPGTTGPGNGLLRIEIDQQGRARVREARAEGMDLEVSLGSGIMGVA